MGKNLPAKPEGYLELLEELKGRISAARVKAALAVNAELVTLYWSIGKNIIQRQEQEGWGAKVLDRLSNDLKAAFPDMKGLSARNLRYMRDLALVWPDEAIVPQLVAKIPWGHNRTLIHKVKERVEREWYIQACIEHGWSRNVLEIQIDTGSTTARARLRRTSNARSRHHSPTLPGRLSRTPTTSSF